MKIINKFLGILAVSMLIFSSCGEEIVREPSPAVKDGNQAVYFATNNTTVYELDPTASASVSVIMERLDSVNAAEVPLKVFRNDSSIFVFPEKVTFAAGSKTATLVVQFPDAQEGIPYTFEVGVDGEDYLNPYSPVVNSIKVSITRVKWDFKGKGQYYDTWTLASVADIDIYYSDLKESYRFASPYSTAMLEEAEWNNVSGVNWIGGPTSEFIMFQIKSNKQVTFTSWYLGLNYQGVAGQSIQAFFPSYLGDIRGITTYDVEDALSKVSDDNDKLLLLNPRIFILGLGGFGVKPCYISMPGGPDLTTLLEL